jgi:HSP20 family protein
MIQVNQRPVAKTWNGIVNELFHDLEQSLAPISAGASRNFPAINVLETQEGYHVELMAPGRNKAYFKLAVENNQLTVSYDAPEQEKKEGIKQIRREFTLGNFKRSFLLDEKVDSGNIQAKYEDGLLKIFLPKKEELKPAQITIDIQ